jgi:hypothetical protein
LLCCLFLTIPFLLPVSIPGISTAFGIVIILIGLGVAFNRLPWLPHPLLERKLPAAHLAQAFAKGANFIARLEGFIRPRWYALTHGPLINRMNGLAVVFGGIMLLFPLSLIPFSNTLPALAILFFAVGILQRDGVFIIAGYVMNALTTLYFGALAFGAVLAGQGLMSIFAA